MHITIFDGKPIVSPAVGIRCRVDGAEYEVTDVSYLNISLRKTHKDRVCADTKANRLVLHADSSEDSFHGMQRSGGLVVLNQTKTFAVAEFDAKRIRFVARDGAA